jgi:hypothetical protein
MKDQMILVNKQNNIVMTQEDLEKIVQFSIIWTIASLIICGIIDFFIRFVVINSLYYRYREKKPNQVV